MMAELVDRRGTTTRDRVPRDSIPRIPQDGRRVAARLLHMEVASGWCIDTCVATEQRLASVSVAGPPPDVGHRPGRRSAGVGAAQVCLGCDVLWRGRGRPRRRFALRRRDRGLPRPADGRMVGTVSLCYSVRGSLLSTRARAARRTSRRTAGAAQHERLLKLSIAPVWVEATTIQRTARIPQRSALPEPDGAQVSRLCDLICELRPSTFGRRPIVFDEAGSPDRYVN